MCHVNNFNKSIENAIASGDWKNVSDSDRAYYLKVLCESLGLNSLTSPIQFIGFAGKGAVKPYATKDCADQLARINELSISLKTLEYDAENGIYTCFASATSPSGRNVDNIGCVGTKGCYGDHSIAKKKAWTQASRRAVLAWAGLGMLEESDAEGVPGATKVDCKQDVSPQPTVQASAVQTNKTAMIDWELVKNSFVSSFENHTAKKELISFSEACSNAGIIITDENHMQLRISFFKQLMTLMVGEDGGLLSAIELTPEYRTQVLNARLQPRWKQFMDALEAEKVSLIKISEFVDKKLASSFATYITKGAKNED